MQRQQRRAQHREGQRALLPGDVPSATSLLAAYDMQLEDCFTYFNPTDASKVLSVSSKWADALVAAAEYLIENPAAREARARMRA